MNITTPILKHLSLQILAGNPYWGLVVANEYLAASSPLHDALVRQFVRRVGSISGELQSLANKLIEGTRFDELPPQLQSKIGVRAFALGREESHYPLTTRRSPYRTARQAPPRLRMCARPYQVTLERRHRSSFGSTNPLNPRTSSRAPHVKLRDVRMSS